jgi:gliding motility-associated-like protein
MNDVQVILDCDGAVCQPCMGEDIIFLTDFAEDDEYEVAIGESVTGNLLSNDDIDNLNNPTIQLASNPVLGVMGINQDGSFEYTPEADFSGTEEFDYIVCSSDCAEECATATIIINIIENELVIPDAISPNGDGLNDTWIIPGLLNKEQRNMTVINRWGDVVYQSDLYNNDWDGTNSNDGKPLPEGTYYYLLKLDLAAGETFKGTITIIR